MARLGIVVCGAPLASRAIDLFDAAVAAGWDVRVEFTDAASNLWPPDEDLPILSRDSDAVIICPLTFNTANKWAAGIADTSWLGYLNELLAGELPIVAVPMVNETLWRHPAWDATLARLSTAGVRFVDPATGEIHPRAVPHGSGDRIAEAFDPEWVLAPLR